MRNHVICDQCFEIDKKIDHYRRIASRTTDQVMLDGIKQLIDRKQAEKAALHPEQQRYGPSPSRNVPAMPALPDRVVAYTERTLACAASSLSLYHAGGVDLIRERTGEGRKRAQANGVKFRRKPKLSDCQRKEAVKRRASPAVKPWPK